MTDDLDPTMVSRRRLFAIAAAATGTTSLAPLMLAACGDDDDSAAGSDTAVPDTGGTDASVPGTGGDACPVAAFEGDAEDAGDCPADCPTVVSPLEDKLKGGDLYIKFADHDNGCRPIIPCGWPNAIWSNQSIWLYTPATSASPSSTTDVATAGVPVYVLVEVHSKGEDFPGSPLGGQMGPKVEAWVCRPTFNFGPANAVHTFDPTPVFSSVNCSQTGIYIAPTGSEWTPSQAEHLCIAANTYYDESRPSTTDPPNEGEPLTTAIILCGDTNRHHGQRNIEAKKAATGAKASASSYMLYNIEQDGEGEYTVEIVERETSEIEALLLPAEVEQLLDRDIVTLEGEDDAIPEVRTIDLSAEQADALNWPVDCPFPIEPEARARVRARGDDVKLIVPDGGQPLFAAGDRLSSEGEGDNRIFLSRSEDETTGELMLSDLQPGADGLELFVHLPSDLRSNPDSALEEAIGTTRVFDILQKRGDEIVGGAAILLVQVR